MAEILDPRFKRFQLISGETQAKELLDQLPAFEVFIQIKETRPFRHEGCVHATSSKMALIFAKEQYSRRGICTGLWVVSTGEIYVSKYTENNIDIYDEFSDANVCTGDNYSIFQMTKRGTQHTFVGEVNADSPESAISCAGSKFDRKKPVLNIWVIKTRAMLKTTEADKEMWKTTPDKMFREAIDYKTGDKLKAFKKENER